MSTWKPSYVHEPNFSFFLYSSYKNKGKNKSESDLGKQQSELYANNGKETEIWFMDV
jgi:hypothetical protein